MSKPTRIGLFGGSFNPVHIGHVELAKEIQRDFPFDQFWIIPTQNPPHKPPFEATGEQRLEMLKLAFRDIPFAQFSRFELEKEGPGYSLLTIEHFKSQFSGASLYFILGTDAFADLPLWYGFPGVLSACSYIISSRKGKDADRAATTLQELTKKGLLTETEPKPPFSKVFKTAAGTQVCLLQANAPEVSSSEVRQRLAAGRPAPDLLPQDVERYLKNKTLYAKSGT